MYFLLWTSESWLRPSWRSVLGPEPFEDWARRKGLSRRLAVLERLKLIEQRGGDCNSPRMIRLTEAGHMAALAGVNPEKLWSRPWDGRWRIVLFDVAEEKRLQRKRLRRSLRQLRFGYLQNSAWISPDPLERLHERIAGSAVDAESLLLFEGRPAGGESDQDLVAGAWDFVALRELYGQWSRIADAVPKGGPDARPRIIAWAASERAIWRRAVLRDPFLPDVLLPAGYPGRAAWSRRVRLLTGIGRLLSRDK